MERAHRPLDLRPLQCQLQRLGVPLVVEHPSRFRVTEDALVVALERRACPVLEELVGQLRAERDRPLRSLRLRRLRSPVDRFPDFEPSPSGSARKTWRQRRPPRAEDPRRARSGKRCAPARIRPARILRSRRRSPNDEEEIERLAGGRAHGGPRRRSRLARDLPSQRTSQKAKTHARGYGSKHQQLRQSFARQVAAGLATCARCGRPIDPDQPGISAMTITIARSTPARSIGGATGRRRGSGTRHGDGEAAD